MKKETANKNKFSVNIEFGTILLITGALANVPLWIGAFASSEAQSPVSQWIDGTALPVLGSLAALAMGFTAAFGLVFVLGHLGKMSPTIERKVRGKDEYKSSPNYRYYMALGAVGLLLIISVVLLSPVALMIVSGNSTLYGVLGSQWAGAWSVGRVLAADLALGAVALVQGVHLGAVAGAKTATQGNPQSDSKSVAAKPAIKKLPLSESLSKTVCRYAGAGCARTFASQNAANAHARTCEYKPTVIDQSLLLPTNTSKAEK